MPRVEVGGTSVSESEFSLAGLGRRRSEGRTPSAVDDDGADGGLGPVEDWLPEAAAEGDRVPLAAAGTAAGRAGAVGGRSTAFDTCARSTGATGTAEDALDGLAGGCVLVGAMAGGLGLGDATGASGVEGSDDGVLDDEGGASGLEPAAPTCDRSACGFVVELGAVDVGPLALGVGEIDECGVPCAGGARPDVVTVMGGRGAADGVEAAEVGLTDDGAMPAGLPGVPTGAAVGLMRRNVGFILGASGAPEVTAAGPDTAGPGPGAPPRGRPVSESFELGASAAGSGGMVEGQAGSAT